MPKFDVRKTITVDAPLEKVRAAIADFREWPKWSPWLIAEPGCKLAYADDGKSYSWDGEIIGAGEMKVEDDASPGAIRYTLTFLKPWKAVSPVGFEFTSRDGRTEVAWTMVGSLPFFLFWMKKSMAAFVGMDYQRGLWMLKDYVEKGAVPSKLEFVGRIAHPGMTYVGVRTRCPIAEVGPRMEQDFEKLDGSGVAFSGKPFSIYHSWDMVHGTTEYTLGNPVESAPSGLADGLVSGSHPACDAFAIRHTGPYLHLGNAWSAGMFHERAKKFRANKKIHPFEIYEALPKDAGEAGAVTVVHFPVR